MRVLQKIVLHPKLENESRLDVRNWCEDNFLPDSWQITSNYTSHGCFNIIVYGRKNASAVSAFILSFPEVQVVESKYNVEATIDEVTFNKNFEYI